MSKRPIKSKRTPERASEKLSEAERLNTFLPEIVALVQPDKQMKPQADGSVRVGGTGGLVLGSGAGLWYDHVASEGGRSAKSLLKHVGVNNHAKWAQKFLDEHKGFGSLGDNSEDTLDSKSEASRLAMEHFIQQMCPITNSLAETYLKSRGINAPYPDNLGWVQDARWGEGAMVAVINGPEGPAAIQLTYVTPEGNKSNVKPHRRTYRNQPDWQAGGGFRLTVDNAPSRTLIAEGVEDALSLFQAKAGTVIIASLGLSNLGKAPVDKTLPVVVFRDGDEPDSPAEKGLARGADRLILQGAIVAVTNTPLGSDANALLQSDGSVKLLDLIENAELANLSLDGHITRCATLSVMEYEQERAALAKELGIRVSTLDKQVKAHRREDDERDAEGAALGIEDIEPWPEPVVLGDVLDDIAHLLAQYIAADSALINTAVLWAAHAHILDRIGVSPRLAAQSPGPGCGKTVALEAVSNLTPRPLTAASITAAVVFRIIEDSSCISLLCFSIISVNWSTLSASFRSFKTAHRESTCRFRASDLENVFIQCLHL